MSNKEELFQLVVVGSSAGGIEALSTLLKTLPPEFPLPIVIAQHLDPRRPSHLPEILSRRSPLKIVSVEDEETLQSGFIYVVPSNRHVQITDSHVAVLPDGEGRPKPSIDRLLTTAAGVFGEKLIAVILTGTGSDGAAGARAVSEAGGTVIIQNPATAAFPGMPQSLAPNTVDIVADLAQIGEVLSSLVSNLPVLLPNNPEAELQTFLEEVLKNSNLDFRSYKSSTLLRRLQRRIIATSSLNLEGYKNYLQTHPEEYGRLVSNFLIKVTEFMRDPEFYDYLREQILPQLVAFSREHVKELRFWSAGCATGEEAYSLAILVAEVLGEELPQFTVKIFATDLDGEAIAFARRGLYPPVALGKLPENLVSTYFNKVGEDYEIKKQLRNLVVFGEHDLGKRAPFPRIDLLLCRNVLIYFKRELQQHALRLFAFALRRGGYLALGRTESVSPLPELFAPQEQRLKVYQRLGIELAGQPARFPDTLAAVTPLHVSGQRQERITLQGEVTQLKQESLDNRAARDSLLLNLPVGVVVVNQHFDVQEINLAARRMLGIHSEALGEDFVHLAQQLPARELANSITRTLRENVITTFEEVQVAHVTTGEPVFLQITCYPQPAIFNSTEKAHTQVVVLISDITEKHQAKLEVQQAKIEETNLRQKLEETIGALAASNNELKIANRRLEEANTGLARTQELSEKTVERHSQQMQFLESNNEALLGAIEELRKNNAELGRANEEFLMRQEEAQAVNEEAETLNEEMQAANEELETLNEELQSTVEELNTANSDLTARGEELLKLTSTLEAQKESSERERAQLELILASMQDAVLVVKPDGLPLLTNAAYQTLIERDGPVEFLDDEGVLLPQTETPGAKAARGEKFSMTFRLLYAGNRFRWCEAVGHPLSSNANFYGGVVVMRDTTERKINEQALEELNRRIVTILESASDAFFALNSQECFTYINRRAEELMGKDRHELLGKNIWEFFPDLLDSNPYQGLKEALQERKAVGYETYSPLHNTWLEVNSYPSEEGGIIVYFRDITRRKQAEAQKIESLGVLAGGIAHDFNNVLGIVVGNLGQIRLEIEDGAPGETVLSLVNDAESAAYRARGLTQQLLTFSSGGAPVKKLHRLPTLLNEWLQYTLQDTKVGYRLDCPEDLWLVELDEGQFGQVLQNLALNGLQAMPEGGILAVKAENTVLPDPNLNLPLPAGNYVKMVVQDQGSGIKPEILSHIFEPYFTTRKQGQGLGLAVVFSIIQRHAGYIEVESQVDKGTTFHIYLPADRPDLSNKEQGKKAKEDARVVVSVGTEQQGGERNTGRLLVLEDEKLLQKLLKGVLEKLGYEVDFTFEGSATVELYREALNKGIPYKIVILDLTIPEGKGGKEVIKELLELDPGVRAIVTSGYNTDPVMANYEEYGFKDFLSKPFTVDQLRQVLEEQRGP